MPNSKVIKGDSKSKAKKTLSTPSATRHETEIPASPEGKKPSCSPAGKDVSGTETAVATTQFPAGKDNPPARISSAGTVDLTVKIKELVRLAQEQGYLTYN